MGYTFHNPDELPKPFDIVWCKFPLRGEVEPGPVARPVLVLASTKLQYEHDGVFREIGALIAQYGGDFKLNHIPDNLHIAAGEFKSLGLHKATVFRLDLGNRARLIWCEEYFVPQGYVKGQGMTAGRLNDEQQGRVLACLKARGLQYPLPPIV